MLAQFVRQAIYDPITCLGIKLKPFSRGHIWLLARFNSPFLDDRLAGVSDLLRAVLICSQDFYGGIEAMGDPMLEKFLKRWGWQIEGGRFQWALTKRARGRIAKRIARATEIFRAYVKAGMAAPDLQVEVSPRAGEIGSDASLLSVTNSMASLGQSFDEAINMYAPLARWLSAAQSERDGSAKVIDMEKWKALKREADEFAREVLGK